METTKTIIRSPLTGDSYTQIRHKSGLNILVCEMDGFQTTQALFCTNYRLVSISQPSLFNGVPCQVSI